ncbi:hypothetical protein KC19_3G147200 [Ceratodon purpureus]|uniref:Uncharacterized protein n=1 Tax=Ceratodon purpureus TaxID=3225 RepID=A0A8T0IL18_CERPU|nr:hypothetical protein KC19_3G147200 [Ceratodon purpureus]KAG0583577.1 hypothetical protein KC19_3G147200 [Ceratodon purpureus]
MVVPGAITMVCTGGSLGLDHPIPQLGCRSSVWRAVRIRAASVDAGVQLESSKDPVLVVVGGGAAGIFGAVRAKTVCPQLKVVVLEKGKLLSKVRISGGGRCNVTTGLHMDPLPLAGQYPRGHKELRGSFFRTHGPKDTIAWFSQRGVSLKKEDDGRMFPVSNSSATIVDCLLNEARRIGVVLQTGVSVSGISCQTGGGFDVKLSKSNDGPKKLGADFVLLSTGSSRQGHELAQRLGHSIVEPQPSLFTFKVKDVALAELAGVSFEAVKAELELPGQKQKNPRLSQTGPLLITHWGLSGPVVLRLSAWAARDLFSSNYQGTLWIDFVPSMSTEALYEILVTQKKSFMKRKVGGASPSQIPLTRRFWQYLLQRENLDVDSIWATLSTKALRQLSSLLKRCPFQVSGKGEFKDEFVTSGGVPLVEVNLKTMESRICPGLFLAGEVSFLKTFLLIKILNILSLKQNLQLTGLTINYTKTECNYKLAM